MTSPSPPPAPVRPARSGPEGCERAGEPGGGTPALLCLAYFHGSFGPVRRTEKWREEAEEEVEAVQSLATPGGG